MAKIMFNISCNYQELVDINDIIYFEKEKKNIKIIFRNATSTSFKLSMKDLQALLDKQKLYNTYFFRPHCSFIVNIKYISEIKGKQILMANRSCIPISQSHKTEFLKKLIDNCCTLF